MTVQSMGLYDSRLLGASMKTLGSMTSEAMRLVDMLPCQDDHNAGKSWLFLQ